MATYRVNVEAPAPVGMCRTQFTVKSKNREAAFVVAKVLMARHVQDEHGGPPIDVRHAVITDWAELPEEKS